ncbi:hypothetical protein FI667_g15977, partial [Globisporangium splendens]
MVGHSATKCPALGSPSELGHREIDLLLRIVDLSGANGGIDFDEPSEERFIVSSAILRDFKPHKLLSWELYLRRGCAGCFSSTVFCLLLQEPDRREAMLILRQGGKDGEHGLFADDRPHPLEGTPLEITQVEAILPVDRRTRGFRGFEIHHRFFVSTHY